MNRKEIYDKYDGKCAYTGKDLGEDWQIDHAIPKCHIIQSCHHIKNHNDIENLFPVLKVVNHYKRSMNLEQFRFYMQDFHKRLAKLPKRTQRQQTIKRIEYMNKVADAFDITVEKAFSGKFYFETIGTEPKEN